MSLWIKCVYYLLFFYYDRWCLLSEYYLGNYCISDYLPNIGGHYLCLCVWKCGISWKLLLESHGYGRVWLGCHWILIWWVRLRISMYHKLSKYIVDTFIILIKQHIHPDNSVQLSLILHSLHIISAIIDNIIQRA